MDTKYGHGLTEEKTFVMNNKRITGPVLDHVGLNITPLLEPSLVAGINSRWDRCSRWDRYLGMTAAMTQVLCPHGYLLGDDVEILMAGDDVFFIKD